MKKEELKADLTLLKKMTVELEKFLQKTYKIRDDTQEMSRDEYHLFTVEVSKAIGLLAGISRESGLLVGDLTKIIEMSPDNPTNNKENEENDAMNFIDKIIASHKDDSRNKN